MRIKEVHQNIQLKYMEFLCRKKQIITYNSKNISDLKDNFMTDLFIVTRICTKLVKKQEVVFIIEDQCNA